MQTNMSARSKEEIYLAAYNYEDKGLRIYSNLSSNLNNGEAAKQVFDGIAAIRANGLALLSALGETKGYKLAKWEHQYIAPSDPAEALVVALNYELELNEFYKSATDNADDDVRDLYFRLWATSNNEYIPALKSALFGGKNGEGDDNSNLKDDERQSADENLSNLNISNLNETLQGGADFLTAAQKIANGEANAATVTELVKSPYFSFFSGVAAGGLLAAPATDFIKKLLEK